MADMFCVLTETPVDQTVIKCADRSASGYILQWLMDGHPISAIEVFRCPEPVGFRVREQDLGDGYRALSIVYEDRDKDEYEALGKAEAEGFGVRIKGYSKAKN